MATHWVFNDCDRQTKADAQSYWARKEGRLSRHLTSFAPDGQELRLTVSHQPQPPAFHVRAVLHLPTGKMVAEETDRQAHVALDRVAHMLVEELKRHKEHLRRDHVYRRKTRRSSGRAGGPGTPPEESEGPAPPRGEGRSGEAKAPPDRAGRDPLVRAMRRLEEALDRPGRAGQKLLDPLRAIQEVLARDTLPADGAEGKSDAVDPTRPSMIRHAGKVRGECAHLLREAGALEEEVRAAGRDDSADFQGIRQRAAGLLDALRRYHDAEAELTYESLYTDIGAGD